MKQNYLIIKRKYYQQIKYFTGVVGVVKAYKQGLSLPMGDHINNSNINLASEKLFNR